MPADFPTRLAAAGLTGPDLRRLGEKLSGQPIARTTVLRWLKGERAPDPWALALLAVIANPKLLKELNRHSLRPSA